MDKKEENFLRELLNDFKIEANEHYGLIINELLRLEKSAMDDTSQQIIETLFRELHSLKGASRAVNQLEIEKLCMALEAVFGSLKKGEAFILPELFDTTHQAMELVKQLITAISQPSLKPVQNVILQTLRRIEFVHKNALAQKKNETLKTNQSEVSSEQSSNNMKIAEINNQSPVLIVSNKEDEHITLKTSAPTEISTEKFKEKETVRVSTAKLKNILSHAEELIVVKSTLEYLTKELNNSLTSFSASAKELKEKTFLTKKNSISKAINHEEEWDKLSQFFSQQLVGLSEIQKNIDRLTHNSGRLIDELLINARTALLYPFASLLNIIPKMARDLGREFSKSVDVKISGEHIEIDRRILEEIKDPIIHLIRNCVDHGIESKAERLKAGKSESGTIKITVRQEIDKKILLKIADDGVGINQAKILDSAIKNGLLEAEQANKLTDKEINALIFASGVSSSNTITTISGRGLGMAIVLEKVEKLGGSIDFESIPGHGTSFSISLPQTIATFRGILIRIGNQYFSVPTISIIKVLQIPKNEIKTIESKPSILINGETIGLAKLSDLLGIRENRFSNDDLKSILVLILHSNQKKLAIVVDEIIGEHEGIIKDLGPQLIHVKNIAGAILSGDGRVVPIIDINELISQVNQSFTTTESEFLTPKILEDSHPKKIIVAEDSITIRNMLRNFIENAGFNVTTAIDGLEAYEKMQTEKFDLLVSDVEMPGLNGFELTSKIRSDINYIDLPIILVTALETAEDRQRGLECGANAYILKSSFDKSALIETINRLL